MGGMFPDHLINIVGKTEEEVKALLDDDLNIEGVKEIKVGVLTVQAHIPQHSPMCVIGA